jgi:hypothetical protein
MKRFLSKCAQPVEGSELMRACPQSGLFLN